MSNILYKHICKKYPDVNYVKGEDLNLDNMYAREIFKKWHNTDDYPTVIDIQKSIGISERTIYRIAKEHKMGNRWELHRLNK